MTLTKYFTVALSSNLSAKNVGGLNVVLLLSNYHLAMFVTGLSFFCIIEFFDKNVVLSITLSCSLLKFTMQFLSSNLLKSLLFLKKPLFTDSFEDMTPRKHIRPSTLVLPWTMFQNKKRNLINKFR